MSKQPIIDILIDNGIIWDLIKYIIFPYAYENTNVVNKRIKRNRRQMLKQILYQERGFGWFRRQIGVIRTRPPVQYEGNWISLFADEPVYERQYRYRISVRDFVNRLNSLYKKYPINFSVVKPFM